METNNIFGDESFDTKTPFEKLSSNLIKIGNVKYYVKKPNYSYLFSDICKIFSKNKYPLIIKSDFTQNPYADIFGNDIIKLISLPTLTHVIKNTQITYSSWYAEATSHFMFDNFEISDKLVNLDNARKAGNKDKIESSIVSIFNTVLQKYRIRTGIQFGSKDMNIKSGIVLPLNNLCSPGIELAYQTQKYSLALELFKAPNLCFNIGVIQKITESDSHRYYIGSKITNTLIDSKSLASTVFFSAVNKSNSTSEKLVNRISILTGINHYSKNDKQNLCGFVRLKIPVENDFGKCDINVNASTLLHGDQDKFNKNGIEILTIQKIGTSPVSLIGCLNSSGLGYFGGLYTVKLYSKTKLGVGLFMNMNKDGKFFPTLGINF